MGMNELILHGLVGGKSKDKTPPPPITNFIAEAQDSAVKLTWVNPVDTDFAGVRIMRKTDGYPTGPSDGTLIYSGGANTHTDTGLVNGTTYYYRAFTFDFDKNFNTDVGQQASAKPRVINIYGVEWNYANQSTALTRLASSAGFSDPVPAVGAGTGSSPFDALYPWSEIDEFNVINNAISHRRGSGSFSRKNNDTVVRIPKFWYKVEQDTANSKMRFYIADNEAPGFAIHPAFDRGDGVVRDYIYIGKYNTGSGYVSRSELAPLVNITRSDARTNSAGKGGPWWQYDYAAWCAAWLLYLVEFADWDSQAKIGKGYTDSSNSAAINTGGADSMTYHTGRAAGVDGKTAVQYRWMENLWGNVRDWVDGINFNERQAYICLNPANFADDTSTNYTSAGVTICDSGWIKGLTMSSVFPFAFLPTLNGGSETTYVPDYVSSITGWRALYVGGLWSNAGGAGLFCFHASNASSNSGSNLGARLLFLP